MPKRLGQRHPARIEFRRGAAGPGPDLGVELGDVSDDGPSVPIKESVAPGEEVEAAVGRPLGGKLHRRRARVRWCRPAWGAGFLVEVVFTPELSIIEVSEIAQSGGAPDYPAPANAGGATPHVNRPPRLPQPPFRAVDRRPFRRLTVPPTGEFRPPAKAAE
jgi:hypothetical protein